MEALARRAKPHLQLGDVEAALRRVDAAKIVVTLEPPRLAHLVVADAAREGVARAARAARHVGPDAEAQVVRAAEGRAPVRVEELRVLLRAPPGE